MCDGITKKSKDIYEIRIKSTGNRDPKEILAEIIEKKANKICGFEAVFENYNERERDGR